MANIPMDGGGHANGAAQNYPQLKSAGSLANWAGAAISLGLILGVGIWGYKLLVRDVSGVPVVRAAEGPMRVRAENPGGRQAENQGLSVNSVAADGFAASTADRLVLAPRAAELEDEDQPLASLTSTVHGTTETETATQKQASSALPQMSSIQALAAQLASGASILGDTADNIYVAEVPNDDAAVGAVVPAAATHDLQKTVNGNVIVATLTRSLRPQVRPSNLRTQNIVSARVETSATALDINPNHIPAGTRLAQLGAYESAEIAKAEWLRISARFRPYMEGKTRVIQKAKSGGRTFYRLRAMGFEDIASARRFCSALAAERADCIPVVTR